MVAVAVLAFMVTILLSITSQTTATWQRAEAQKNRQQTARIVLEMLSRDLESMVLPIDSADQKGFQFVVNPAVAGASIKNADAAFWQAVLSGASANGDVSQVGYFLRWTQQDQVPLGVLCRFYLSPELTTANLPAAGAATQEWLDSATIDQVAPGDAANNHRGSLAENVIALWITPLDAEGNELAKPFDTRVSPGQLASVQIAIAVIDPTTALRIKTASEITALYAQGPDGFAENLPDSVKAGVRVFKTQVPIKASHRP